MEHQESPDEIDDANERAESRTDTSSGQRLEDAGGLTDENQVEAETGGDVVGLNLPEETPAPLPTAGSDAVAGRPDGKVAEAEDGAEQLTLDASPAPASFIGADAPEPEAEVPEAGLDGEVIAVDLTDSAGADSGQTQEGVVASPAVAEAATSETIGGKPAESTTRSTDPAVNHSGGATTHSGAEAPSAHAPSPDGRSADALSGDGPPPTSPTIPTSAKPADASSASNAAPPTGAIPVTGPPTSTVVTASAATTVAGSAGAAPATGATAWEQVGASIASTVRTLQDGSHRLLLRLHPEELGSVVLELTVSGERVDVRLLAQQVGTRDLLTQTANQLRQDLDQNGLSLGSMDVDLERGPESESTDEDNTDSGGRRVSADGSTSSRRTEARLGGVRRSDSTLDLDL